MADQKATFTPARLLAILREAAPGELVLDKGDDEVVLDGHWDLAAVAAAVQKEFELTEPDRSASSATISIGKRQYPESYIFADDIKEALEGGVTIVRSTKGGTWENIVGLVAEPDQPDPAPAEDSDVNNLPECGSYRHHTGALVHLAWLARRPPSYEWYCCFAQIGTLARFVCPASEWFETVDDVGTRRFEKLRNGA